MSHQVLEPFRVISHPHTYLCAYLAAAVCVLFCLDSVFSPSTARLWLFEVCEEYVLSREYLERASTLDLLDFPAALFTPFLHKSREFNRYWWFGGDPSVFIHVEGKGGGTWGQYMSQKEADALRDSQHPRGKRGSLLIRNLCQVLLD